MALGELVSVCSQKDTAKAEIAREIAEQNKGNLPGAVSIPAHASSCQLCHV